ncbi:polysaccharide lyase [Hyalangium versicolor]|uniref:polysaccharide lyase n=1 Tax=Hyalangium versicolor TaxID=2861190 RepID=UPI001CCBEB9E|nr:polysaccharide lyase [Hyalangium versicolor]
MRLLPLWLAALLVSGPAMADIVWKGDFETGDRSQYSTAQMVSADRLQVVTSPVAEGQYALKATVKQGDDPIDSSGNRNELVYQGKEAVGSEYYYRWKVMFAADFPSARTWQVFTQWHHDGCCGSPPVEFFVYGEEIRLTMTDSVTPWSMPLTRGVWHEFVFHVKWSSDPSVGFIELWHNREKVLAKRNLATLYAGSKVYLKLGLYRSDTISQTGVVYHDGFIQATKLEDVLPSTPAPTPDAGTPDAGTGDAGSPSTPDAGVSSPEDPGTGGEATPPVTTPGDNPGTGTPGVGTPTDPGSVEATQYGCTASGGPLAVMALITLLGLVGLRRWR